MLPPLTDRIACFSCEAVVELSADNSAHSFRRVCHEVERYAHDDC